MKRLKVFLLVLTIATCLGACTMSKAEINTAEIKSGESEVLNKNNLDVAKRFILKNGQTCTWSNMYNNNPCFATANYNFYLNPDPGGPHNHPQWNINCDPKKGDFNSLVIRSTDQQKEIVKDSKVTIDNLNLTLNFIGKDKVEFRTYGSKVDDIAAIKSSEIAVKELLIAVKNASRIKNKSRLNKPQNQN
jgi:hypothetical protein